MKYIAFIFTVYLMGVLILPCSDSFSECKISTNTSEQVTVQASSHHDMNNANDTCSPFCNCNCCYTTIAFKGIVKKAEPIRMAFQEKDYPISNQVFVSNYYGNIWQPPKLNS